MIMKLRVQMSLAFEKERRLSFYMVLKIASMDGGKVKNPTLRFDGMIDR